MTARYNQRNIKIYVLYYTVGFSISLINSPDFFYPMPNLSKYCQELIKEIKKQKTRDQKSLNKLKMALAEKHKIKTIPKNAEILNYASEQDRDALNFVLSMKPTRTLSGVAVVAIMTAPSKCPHGKCSFCPGGMKSEFGDVPQSYTGKEPTTRRAIRNLYDPYLQVFNRLEQYIVMNKIPDKVEIIVMGGTFPATDKSYQNEFITYTFKAMNDFSALFFNNKTGKLMLKEFLDFFELPGAIDDEERQRKIHEKCLMIKEAIDPADQVWNPDERSKIKKVSKPSNKSKPKKINLKNEQSRNQTSKIRCVGLTIETRPDWASLELANSFLDFGCTRVELGVQSIYDSVLKRVDRGHSVKDTITATRTLKDLGFKINYQVMPGLPGVNKKQDLAALKELFKNPDFRPDMLKIYPCMVMKGTKLYLEWKKGKFKPLTTKQAAEIIAEFKAHIPEYVRIMRVQRDIPTFVTESGVDRTNLRQYIAEVMKKKGIVCRCIRCREIGRYDAKQGNIAGINAGQKAADKRLRASKIASSKASARSSDKTSDKITIIEYKASLGTEFFIAAEHNDHILGFCRLRFPSQQLRREITKDSALIRELHVYGAASEVGEKDSAKTQHKGVGKALLKQAEDIAKAFYKKKIVIISGVGVREYYRKQGYELEGPYMIKRPHNIS